MASHIANGTQSKPHLVMVAMAAAVGAFLALSQISVMAARIVKQRPVFVTLFTTVSFYERIVDELARNFDSNEQDARDRLRVVALPSKEGDFLDIDSLSEGFEVGYQDLVAERPITCAKTGVQHAAISHPTTVVLDIFAHRALTTARTHSKIPVKVYSFVVCSASAYHQHFGVASPNKNKNVRAFIQKEIERTGKSSADLAVEVFFKHAKGDVLSIPGLPYMFDYEEYPQKLIMDEQFVAVFRMNATEVTDQCDGLLLATPHAFETPEILASLSQYYDGEVYPVGPLLPTASDASVLEKSKSKDTQEIDALMTRVLESHGPQSLVYVSFGSHFWTAEPDKVWAFLDAIMERKLPFIFAHASPFAEVPEAVKEKVKRYGLGLLSPWSPQQYILTHPVVGWFVTHCGFNSLLESVSAGVPLICWPFSADQPANALHTVVNLDIAYELFEVRTGEHGLKPVFRTGTAPTGTLDAVKAEAHRVFELAFGSDGAKKREKVQILREKFARAWDVTDEGLARVALASFLDKL
ncbi:hypothetical protein EIP86_000212 [Pleurotus ostreatoroseus]|nr:hypothetical protein EIP86_000212 [Pleurotus ostreatoroseus]